MGKSDDTVSPLGLENNSPTTDADADAGQKWPFKVIKYNGDLVVEDVKPLDCIVSKDRNVQIAPNVDLATKKKKIPSSDLDTVPYLTFSNIDNDATAKTESDTTSGSTGPVNDSNVVNGGTSKKELRRLPCFRFR